MGGYGLAPNLLVRLDNDQTLSEGSLLTNLILSQVIIYPTSPTWHFIFGHLGTSFSCLRLCGSLLLWHKHCTTSLAARLFGMTFMRVLSQSNSSERHFAQEEACDASPLSCELMSKLLTSDLTCMCPTPFPCSTTLSFFPSEGKRLGTSHEVVSIHLIQISLLILRCPQEKLSQEQASCVVQERKLSWAVASTSLITSFH